MSRSGPTDRRAHALSGALATTSSLGVAMLSRVALLKWWEDIRSSYWFIPTLMAVGAIALSIGAVFVDSRIGADWLEAVPWLYENRPAGARDLLSTIAGSMITVAGVTFSITIAAVAYAASQFGPRLLTNFMGDRGNQVTLGVFIATFLYCLLVLRTIRDGSEVAAGTPLDATEAAAHTAFVPHSAILVALALAVLSVGVLIYFIHHVPQSIHVSNVIAAVGRDLIEGIDRAFPEADASREEGSTASGPGPREAADRDTAEGNEADPVYTDDADPAYTDEADPAPADAVLIDARRTGYVQRIDDDGPAEIAEEHDLVVRLVVRPGDFVRAGQPLVYAWPADGVTEDTADRLRGAFAFGDRRTHAQDIVFLVNELAEISSRALSQGVNDPFTASACVDWLGAAGVRLAERPTPELRRLGPSGQVRLFLRPLTFRDFLAEGFGRIRPYAASDVNACLHQLASLAGMAAQVPEGDCRLAVLEEARALAADAHRRLEGAGDRRRVAARLRALEDLIEGRATVAALAWRHRWFLGRA